MKEAEIMVEDKVKEILAKLFGLNIATLSDHTSPDNVEKWDSLGHLNLIMELERVFNIHILPEDITKMTSLKAIKDIISKKYLATI
jgi:acyl carrier protein